MTQWMLFVKMHSGSAETGTRQRQGHLNEKFSWEGNPV
jgi:hypothetical protein